MMTRRHSAAGFTLVELMVGLTLASLTILGAFRLYAHSASLFRASQSEQSLENAAQLAINVLRRDIELAGFVPLVPAGETIPEYVVEAATAQVRNDCADQWAIKITEPVGASDNGYRLDCPAYQRSPAPAADTLVLRYVDPQPVGLLEPGRIYLQLSGNGAQIFAASNGSEAPADSLVMTHEMRVRGYYVSTTSSLSSPSGAIPSLRVKHLTERNGRAVIVDEEVLPGVEDLQVEFDTGIGEFVTAAGLVAGDPVHSVRIWLLIRSAYQQNTADGYIPAYAGRTARVLADGYRRRLITTSIAISDDRPL